MASFSVTITNNTTPAVGVTLTGSTTYAQFKNSLGNFVYEVDQTYTYSPNINQIQGNYRYSKYDVNGNQNQQTILSTIDPYQSFNSLYTDTSDKDLILDGRDTIKFNLLPNTYLSVKLFSNRIAVEDKLDSIAQNNFKQLENISGMPNFFEEYKDFL
jgi:hypothetical protein